MVGFDAGDKLTAQDKLIAGCMTGMLTRFITQPMDVIKLRTQVAKLPRTPKRKWFRYTRKILREEGIMAFWHGHNLGQIYSIMAVSSQFFIYELTTKYVANTQLSQPYKKALVFFCGMFSGCCSATLVLPLEVIRVRQMLVKEQYKGIINGAREVYATGGILAFYHGLSASLLQMGPQVGISFFVFRFTQPLILRYLHICEDGKCLHESGANKHKPEHILLASTVAGSVAGFIAKTITYPFDLTKRRMQIGSHIEDQKFKTPSTSKNIIKCQALTDCLVNTVRKEGFWGLYRGWKVTVYKAQITSILTFTSYELMCYLIRELHYN